MAQVRLENITKWFGRPTSPAASDDSDASGWRREEIRDGVSISGTAVSAVDNVNLLIQDGETISIVGPSGCGKTTLLRIIAGLEVPDQGRVFYDDTDVTDTAPSERNIGMVFQNYALYPHMKSRGNLSFFFRMHKREDEIDERVRITSEILGVGFTELLDRKPKELSGGQRQRVAIGRCIVREPRVFLFDEPLSNLDAKLRARTRVEVKRLLRRFNITSVYVTHDQIEAIALADRIVVMRQGKIEQIGTYWDLVERPKNRFIAGFLGLPPATFLEGTVEGNRVDVEGGSIRLPDWAQANVSPGQRVAVGLRPDHVQVAQPGEASDLVATVAVIEPMLADHSQLLHLDIPGSSITAKAPLDVGIARGDKVPITIDRNSLLLFDARSEQNLALRAETE
ncbi:MAG TPA: ABC transporter ATP-binding protein [Chloroflexota bacterium]|nr:ABC transporter ATP-binding protein [Chloroflexota bacterium]